MIMRALVIGHFSTVGDIEVLREVEHQLKISKCQWDVAPLSKKMVLHHPRWLDVRGVRPSEYTHLLVVCGPFWRPYYIQHSIDLDAFAHCVRIGINLTMIEDLDQYNPFDVLLGRDNSKGSAPDLSFLHEPAPVAVAGLCLVGAQKEYGGRQQRDIAGDLLRSLAKRRGLAVVELDTEWPAERNMMGLASPEQFESVCSRLDVMLTTRLHGTVLSLKNGVPVIALDAIVGGGKVSQQAGAIGWPEVFTIDVVNDAVLDQALKRCLEPETRSLARKCAAGARTVLATFGQDFSAALDITPKGKPSYTGPMHQPSRAQRKFAKVRKKFGWLLKQS